MRRGDCKHRRWRRRSRGSGFLACGLPLAALAFLCRGRFYGSDGSPTRGSEVFESGSQELPMLDAAFSLFDDKDGRFCAKDGDLCDCFGRVRYGRLFSWSDDVLVDGTINCTASAFGDLASMQYKVCKCYPTICTTNLGTCTPEPCRCPSTWTADVVWRKKTLMTSDGVKCWACERQAVPPGLAVDNDSEFCPSTPGRCSRRRSCKCEKASATKRPMRTKEGARCWTCAPLVDSSSSTGSGQEAMFWMLPMLWPFMDFPNSLWQVGEGCRTLSVFLLLCIVGYVVQNFVPFLNLNRVFSFFAPCMKKGEFWRLFTYFMLHSDLQHLCVNLMHLLDALDLEGVPDLEVSPGVPLRCTRDGPVGSICYPDVGIGSEHLVAAIATVLAFGALVGTLRNFGALVQGASSVCFGIDGALIALYAMFLGAGLDEQLRLPEFSAFFWMRIGIIAFHMIIDMIQSACGSGKDSVGTLAHAASFVAGFCYVILVLPPMGDRSLFETDRPYILDCGITSPRFTTLETATEQCLAFFHRGYGLKVGTARGFALFVLASGVAVSIVNGIVKWDVSDDGIAVCGSNSVFSENKVPQVRGLQEDVRNLGRFVANVDRITWRSD